MSWTQLIRTIPDFPKKGILFYDITPVLQNPQALKQVADHLAKPYQNQKIDFVAGIESRGFIFGSLLAQKLGAGFVPIRKQGKLPHETLKQEYELEYGKATIEIHKDAFGKGDRVLLCDDLLATGGTCRAATFLVEKLGAEVAEIGFVIELSFLNGRKNLEGYNVQSLAKFDQ
ncbi:MAG: adenine phosphoribosyltransferase [Candidatus Micrarchaeota archaeon]